MNRTQKLVVTLLIVTIILSVFSISLNFVLLNLDLRPSVIREGPPGVGNVQLMVEGSTSAAGGPNG